MTNEHGIGEPDNRELPLRSTLVELKDRLYRGEHLAVAEDYLDGRLQYVPSDWQVASLVGLAMRHHFAALEREGKLVVGFAAEQIDDGLAITIRWPEDRAVDEVEISLELTDSAGASALISRQFQRSSDSGRASGGAFGSALASDQTVVLRPLRSAVEIRATARPSHRLRFDESVLAPQLRFCTPDPDTAPHHNIQFRPVEVVERTHIDVYREAQGRDILELVTPLEQRQRAQRARARRRRRRIKRVLKVTAAVLALIVILIGGLVLVHRYISPFPGWIPPGSGGVVSSSTPSGPWSMSQNP